MNRFQRKMSSPIGVMYLVASDKGLQGIHWAEQLGVPYQLDDVVTSVIKPTSRHHQQANVSHQSTSVAILILNKTEKQLTEYFAGERQLFDIPFDVVGTPFQMKVWAELSKIPYGETCSYQDIAARINNAKACRAVGTANGRNPISVIVPCHRVIAANGTLGGYAGGLPNKEVLLNLERNTKFKIT